MKSTRFEGFEVHGMPCEGCGEVVRIESADVESTTSLWAEGDAAFFCANCWDRLQSEETR